MERHIWECKVCGHDVLPESIVLEGDEWSSEAIAIYPDGESVEGKFNVLGMIGEKTLFDGEGARPAVVHSFCQRNAGTSGEFPGPSQSSPMSEYNGFFRMIKDLGKRRKKVYEGVLKELKSTGEEVDAEFHKISGEGNAVIKFSALEELSHTVCGADYVLNDRAILLVQRQLAKVWAEDMRSTGSQAKKFQPEIASYYDQIVASYERIVDILDNTLREIGIIKEDINELAMAVNAVPEPKMKIADFRLGIAKDVVEKGWAVMAISDEIPFAYTIGLYKNFKHPEIAVTAIGQNQASELLNRLAERVASGERFELGKIYEKEDGMRRSMYARVENKNYRDHFGTAQDYYNGLYFPVIQRVTADKEGRFPWDEGCEPVLKAAQKLLGKPKITE